jgi:hypothetical protein
MYTLNLVFQSATLIKIILLFLLFIISLNLSAQIGRGCYVDGVLYTENTAKGNRFFYRTSGVLLNDCGFIPTGNDGNCRLYNGGNINNNNSYTLYEDSFSNDWEVIPCPLDKYVWYLLVSISTFSFFRLRYNSFKPS